MDRRPAHRRRRRPRNQDHLAAEAVGHAKQVLDVRVDTREVHDDDSGLPQLSYRVAQRPRVGGPYQPKRLQASFLQDLAEERDVSGIFGGEYDAAAVPGPPNGDAGLSRGLNRCGQNRPQGALDLAPRTAIE